MVCLLIIVDLICILMPSPKSPTDYTKPQKIMHRHKILDKIKQS